MHVNQILKMCKEEFDRLMETSPNIPDEIIKEFKNKFKDSLEYDDIIKPEICDKLISTETFRNQWASQDNLIKKKNLKSQKDDKMKQIVSAFKSDFSKMQGREPVRTEIIDNLKDKIDVKTINSILDEIDKDIQRANMANIELPV